jgi:hypothetical protein
MGALGVNTTPLGVVVGVVSTSYKEVVGVVFLMLFLPVFF